MKHRLIILFCLLVLNGCTNKLPAGSKLVVTCGTEALSRIPIVNSEIVKFDLKGIADTTIASISGTIFSKDSSALGITIDALPFATVIAVDSTTGKLFGTNADSIGHYRLTLPSSNYNLRFTMLAYGNLKIESPFFGKGSIWNLDVMLGQGLGENLYKVTADNRPAEIYHPVKFK